MPILFLLFNLMLPLGAHALSMSASTPRMTEYGYPSAKLNRDLCDELYESGDRLIPQADWGCAGLDADIFLRTLGDQDFYHGFGYWLQLRSQLQPNPYLRLNIRSLFYSGSISYGYTRPLGFYNLIGFTAIWPESFFGGTLTSRVMDLDRQTVGAGLILQDHETAGLLLEWERGELLLKILADGTGGLLLTDDLKNYEISAWQRGLAIGYVEWTEGTRGVPPYRSPMAYVASEVQWTSVWSTALEVAEREAHWGYLARLAAQVEGASWKLFARLEGRLYENHFADQFAGRIEHLYTSYDQYEKRFMNPANIFVIDDHVVAGSFDFNFAWKMTETSELQFLNEVVNFHYREAPREFHHFYRAGWTYLPAAQSGQSLSIFVSNKVLSDSFALPPFSDSTKNVFFFKNIPFIGVEAKILL